MSYYLIDEKPLKLTLSINCVEWNVRTGEGFMSHYHKPLELIAVTEGQMLCTSDTKKYTLNKGNVLLFNPYTIHEGFATLDNTKYYCLTFTPSKIFNYKDSVLFACGEALENQISSFDEYYTGDNAVEIFDCIRKINLNLNTHTPTSETIVLSQLYGLMSHLFEKFYNENKLNAMSKRDIKFLINLSNFLADNYAENITSSHAAKALLMSTSHFSHLVRRHFTVSFSKYLCQYRIIAAINKYTNSGMNVKEIASAVGFNDYCYFSRAFKGYTGKSPAVYFGKWKKRQQ